VDGYLPSVAGGYGVGWRWAWQATLLAAWRMRKTLVAAVVWSGPAAGFLSPKAGA